ncbi:glutathionylspermidine synthase family protein [Phenylobacterium sp.]|uniref:glutathionylspermidine synthase family protein n=1 Tax=Phenylobacterium sp. TaxID=1871053 RepID=UPI00273435DE|nr:glutathionylspermidine synthase family protein [Phenylobacterium sp.]MDP3855679.1 glutathionylspermidine synthase family protein [Phenylobacterium sp.]
MRRIALSPRRDWKAKAEAVGFTWHHADGRRYWDERAYYAFTLNQVEDHIEAATAELHRLCLELVAEVVESPALMTRLAIPEAAQALVAASWKAKEPSLYGRFDFFYDGSGPPKLYEYNADTPTSIYEAAVFQWLWLEDRIADGALPAPTDQFNSLYEALRDRFKAIFPQGGFVHFASEADFVEDRQTVRFLEDVAGQAGLTPKFVALDKIGLDADGRFVDAENFLIGAIFKLYPWEQMFRDTYGDKIAASRTQFIEPAWKAVLSNKGLLPLLWERHAGHPNLLEAWFDDDPRADGLGRSYVRKPLFSREGANLELYDKGRRASVLDQGYGAEGWIRQALCPPPKFGANYAVVGSWVIGDEPAGMGIREDRGRVTRDRSRFVPHVILETAEVIPIRRGS